VGEGEEKEKGRKQALPGDSISHSFEQPLTPMVRMIANSKTRFAVISLGCIKE
jgi:hypothetical protein